MLVALISILAPFMDERYIERTNDPFTILWVRAVANGDSDAAIALSAYDPKRAVGVLRFRIRFETLETRLSLATALLELGAASQNELAIIDAGLNFKTDSFGADLSLRTVMRLIALGDRVSPMVPSLLRYIKNCDVDKGGLEACIIAQSKNANAACIAEIIALLRRSGTTTTLSSANRALIATALGNFGARAKDAVPILESMLKSGDGYAAVHAAVALMRIDPGSKVAVAYLIDQAQGKNDLSRQAIGFAFRDSPVDSPARLLILTKLLKNSAAKERDLSAACQAIAKLGQKGRPAIETLRTFLVDTRSEVRLAAAYATVSIDPADEKAVNVLVAAMQDGQSADVSLATRYCSWLKSPPKSLLPGLRKALQSDLNSAIANAAETIIRIDANDAQTLVTMRKLAQVGVPNKPDDVIDRTNLAKWQAVDILARFGPRAKAARPDLIKLLRTADGEMLRSVAAALKAIDQRDPANP